MGNYLKKFDLTSQYEEYINSAMALLPNVSLTVDENMIYFNPKVIEVGPNYLKFTAEEDNSTIALNSVTSPDIKYSLNGGEWTQWDYSAITLNTGDTVRMKGNNSNGFSTSDSSYNQFKMSGKIGASGNIMSLLYEDDFEGKLNIPCEYCFCYMFMGCSSLTTAPELPATTLTAGCYNGMFSGCTSLTTAPELPAKRLYGDCYNYMFYGCTTLTTAPELPAITLDYYCYCDMFMGCSSLTTAPELPATTLTAGCYNGMFKNCTSLTTAPELPATILTNNCYQEMFYGCTKLNYIKMLATDISATGCLHNWVSNVASTGTFVKHQNMTSLPIGNSGIPKGWTDEDGNPITAPILNWLTFTAEEDNSTISLNAKTSPDIKYSLNDGEWAQWDYSTITLNTGDTVRMKGNNSNGFNTTYGYEEDLINRFNMTGKIGASGNIMSLIYGDDFEGKLTIPCDYCFCEMFLSCYSLTTAPELPAATLATYCYYYMFRGCTSLTTAPELPAATLASKCYSYMFQGCTKLNYIKMLATDVSAYDCLYAWLGGVSDTGTFVKHKDMTTLPTGTSGIPEGWTVEDAA